MRSKTSVFPYSPERLSFVEDRIRSSERKGIPLFYEIEVDGNIVIPRTQDVEEFEQVGEFIGSEMQLLVVYIYQGKSYHRDRYVFYKGARPNIENDSMNGIETNVEETESPEEIARQEKKRRKKLKKENKELHSCIEELEQKVDELENRRLTLGSLISAGLDGLVRSNTKIIRQFGRGGETLAGLIEADTQARQAETESGHENESPENGGGAQFERSTDTENEISEAEKELLIVVRSILVKFSEKQQGEVNGIIKFISDNPDSIPTVLRFLHNLETSIKSKKP